METLEDKQETSQEDTVQDLEILNEDEEGIVDPDENLTEEENELATSANKDKLDWVKLRTIIHSKPKELDSTSKLTEDDIYNMLVEQKMHGDLAKMLSSMSIVVRIVCKENNVLKNIIRHLISTCLAVLFGGNLRWQKTVQCLMLSLEDSSGFSNFSIDQVLSSFRCNRKVKK